MIPFYTSPFEIMSKKLSEKLNRTRKGNRKKKALNKGEMKGLLAWLQEDQTLMGLCNYAMTFMLLTSGLRASELCQLTWASLEYFEDKWTAQFIGKGDRQAEQELYTLAVEASRTYFVQQFGRDPQPADHLYWTIPTYKGETIRPMVYATLLLRIKNIGEAAREAGIIKRNVHFTPHLMRRSYATGLYKSGMGIKAIQNKTRHQSLDTLTTHYISDEDAASPFIEKMLA